jgi:O-antigen/teichoic acid export membrane protein
MPVCGARSWNKSKPDMTTDELKNHIYRNSISNYVFLVIRLGLGVVLFRLIYQSLSQEEFGFWGLLWSVFGYGILLDFGFGFTAQKRVAELSASQKWHELSQVLSTIFFSYVAIALILIAFGLFASPYLIHLFKIHPENSRTFVSALTIFFCGMGVAFPMGIFPEILKGQQRISLANYTLLGGFLVSFCLVLLCLHQKWGLNMLLVITLGCSMASDLLCGLFAFHHMPGVRIHPNLFSRDMVRNTMRFSIFAYITTLTTVILTRTDQLVLSTMLAVSSVAIYLAGAKVSEMFTSFALQIPDTLSPAAAHSHAKGDKEFLRSLLINGTRFSVMFATPMYLLCAFYLNEIVWLLTGKTVPDPETIHTGQVLLFWGYTTILTQSVTKRIFMMTGHERRLMWLGVGEALFNLILSVGLLWHFHNVVCVAVGSLIATFVFGWFYIWPWAARESNLSPWHLARKVLVPSWVACLPIVALILVERYITLPQFRNSVYALILEGGMVFLLAFVCMWRLALHADERERFCAYFSKFFGKSQVKNSVA